MEDKKEVPFEYQILALALRTEGAIELFHKSLEPESVGLIHGQTGIYEFYKALVSFYDKTGLDPIDPIAFKSWLETETDIAEAVGGISGVSIFIDELMQINLSTPESIVQITNYRANKRKQLDKLQELKELISAKSSHTDNTRISLLTDEIRVLESALDYDPLASVVTANDIANRVDDLWDIPPFIPTQFKSLNRAMAYTDEGGFFRGAVHSVIAQSGFGKSTFVKCLANHWLDTGYSVLFINFEEASAHWERVLLTQITGVNVYAESANLSRHKKDALTTEFQTKMAQWGERLMVRHDPDSLYFEDLEKWLRDIIGNGSRIPDVVIIDTIQSLFTKTGGKQRWGEFEQIMVRLEKLARDMNSAFIITSQENTNREKEKRDVVNKSDAGGSITIIQKSSVAIFITPKKLASDDDTVDECVMQLQIPKNRITGTAFTNDPPEILYIDSIKSYVPWEPSESDERYNSEYIDSSILEGGII